MEINEKYMWRAIELAASGRGFASPNPMVGAVIAAPDGRIIGEGWHRRCGEAHAEVNAVASVSESDRKLIPESTIYVTLEPCAHYGKTPPCAVMLANVGFKKVVVASVDPFSKVNGRGIAILREAGAEVVTGVLDDVARRLNAKFFTAHTEHRPWITLKWAQSADGYLDHVRDMSAPAARFSTPMSSLAVQRLRASHDAIAVGLGTYLADRPKLTLRLWPGSKPKPMVLCFRGISSDTEKTVDNIAVNNRTATPQLIDAAVEKIPALLDMLYRQGGTSLLVEGGAFTLKAFIDSGFWDMARIETAAAPLGEKGAVPAPHIGAEACHIDFFGPNMVQYFANNPLADVKNL